jgi:hypothetical protein
VTTADKGPRSVTIEFPDNRDADPKIEIGPQVTIGQLAESSWWLNRLATEARTGQVMAQQIEAQQRQALAAGLRNGGRG